MRLKRMEDTRLRMKSLYQGYGEQQMGEEMFKYDRQVWYVCQVDAWNGIENDNQRQRRTRKGYSSKRKIKINREVNRVRLSKWKNEMERKRILNWYREKEISEYENQYDGNLGGGDLLFRAS